jgi:glutathione S-transferase
MCVQHLRAKFAIATAQGSLQSDEANVSRKGARGRVEPDRGHAHRHEGEFSHGSLLSHLSHCRIAVAPCDTCDRARKWMEGGLRTRFGRGIFLVAGHKEEVMKLYFAPGACSLSPHIVLREAGAKFDLEQVDLREKKTKNGDDYWTINPKGQVPLLELDDGQMISEGPAIVQYVADKNPGAGIIPAAGSIDRYHLQGWLTHIGTELHKTYGPMFRPTTPDEYKKISKETLANKYKNIDKMLEGKQYLMGDKFTVADAYLYTVTRWAPRVEFDLSPFPNVKAFMERMNARPKVQEALKAEGLS